MEAMRKGYTEEVTPVKVLRVSREQKKKSISSRRTNMVKTLKHGVSQKWEVDYCGWNTVHQDSLSGTVAEIQFIQFVDEHAKVAWCQIMNVHIYQIRKFEAKIWVPGSEECGQVWVLERKH